jgi:type IV secretory pathway VirB2 component (pilin)
MRINSILAAVAAASLAVAPAVAAPKPVGAPANSEIAPAGETVQGEQIRGGFLLPLAIIIAIIIGVLLLTNDDEDPISA